MAAILHVHISDTNADGTADYVKIHLTQSTLLDLNLALDITLLDDPNAPPESKQVDWINKDGSLNVIGDRNKLTLIVNIKGINQTVIRHLNEEESKQFRKKVTLLI